MENLPAENEITKLDNQTSEKKLNAGGLNTKFPKEYEEQVSPAIRMKPQPFNKGKK